MKMMTMLMRAFLVLGLLCAPAVQTNGDTKESKSKAVAEQTLLLEQYQPVLDAVVKNLQDAATEFKKLNTKLSIKQMSTIFNSGVRHLRTAGELYDTLLDGIEQPYGFVLTRKMPQAQNIIHGITIDMDQFFANLAEAKISQKNLTQIYEQLTLRWDVILGQDETDSEPSSLFGWLGNHQHKQTRGQRRKARAATAAAVAPVPMP